MELPAFKYHPDPVSTGSIRPSDAVCACCGQRRGAIYVGPVYAQEDLDACICPWCIADGSAHETYDVEFTDAAGIGGYGRWDAVPEGVVEEVAYRTPGFSGWQQEQWWTHCGDAAQFLGAAGRHEIEAYGAGLIDALRADADWMSDEEWQRYYRALDKNRGPTAYVFRCRHCGTVGGYSDCH